MFLIGFTLLATKQCFLCLFTSVLFALLFSKYAFNFPIPLQPEILHLYGQYQNSDIGLKSVYSYSANEWDLYDMSGNIYEWLDDNEENYFSSQKDKKNEEEMTRN